LGVDRSRLTCGKPASTLDDQGVLEELDLEIVLVDAGEVDEDLHGGGRLVGIGIGPPAGLDK
jgi:hypothetical protein